MVTDTQVKTGYKLTELGEIPIDWVIHKLSDLSTAIGDGIHATPQYNTNNEYFFINGNNLLNGDIHIDDSTKSVPHDEYRKHYKELNRNTILMSINGTIGNLAYYKDEKVILGKSAAFINLKSNIPVEYIYYLLQTNYIKTFYEDGLTGSTIKNLGLGTIRDTPVLLPSSKKEREEIKNALVEIDMLTNRLDKLIEKKRNIKQGTMQELLTGKRRLPGFSDEWEEIELKNIADFLKGQGLSKGKLSPDGKYQCVLYGELFTTYTRTINDIKSRTDTYEGLLSKKGDILMPGSTTTVGIDLATASALELDNVLLGGDIIVIRKTNQNDYNSYFLANNLTYISKYKIAEISQGITIIHLHGSRLKEITITIPTDIKEQNAIAGVLHDMNEEIVELENKKNKYLDIKQGMMQQLLTGRIRLV